MTRLPWLTRSIVLLNCAIALYSECLSWTGHPDWVRDHGTLTYEGWRAGEWWRLFGYMWLHAPWEGAGILHLIFNMATLAVLGSWLERRLGMLRFGAVYVLGGLAAGLAFLLEIGLRSRMGLAVPEVMAGGVVGASGGVAALFGAFAVVFPEIPIWLFLVPWPVRALRAYWIFVFTSVALIFVPAMSWMAHGAHLGGAFTGYLLLRSRLLFRRSRPGKDALLGQGVWQEAGLRAEVDAMSREELIQAYADLEKRWREGGRWNLTERDRLVARRLGEWLKSEDS